LLAADPSTPLLVFYAPHVAHCPLQVPKEYYDKFSFMEDDEGEKNISAPVSLGFLLCLSRACLGKSSFFMKEECSKGSCMLVLLQGNAALRR